MSILQSREKFVFFWSLSVRDRKYKLLEVNIMISQVGISTHCINRGCSLSFASVKRCCKTAQGRYDTLSLLHYNHMTIFNRLLEILRKYEKKFLAHAKTKRGKCDVRATNR